MVILISLVILLLPSGIKLRITQPLAYGLLFPLRVVASLRTTLSILSNEYRQMSYLVCELILENTKLKSELNSQDTLPTTNHLKTISAQIIARDLTTLKRHFTINRGSEAGITSGAFALTHQGVVGKVIATTRGQALIQTIFEPGFRMAVLNSRSREVGMAHPGPDDLLLLDYISKEADFRVGDTIITAGLGGIFPKGLRVGIVVSVQEKNDLLFKNIRVKPFVNLSQLEHLFIVTPSAASPSGYWFDGRKPSELKIPE